VADPTIAFPVQRRDLPAIEVRVNFGMFAGRGEDDAGRAELERRVLERAEHWARSCIAARHVDVS
jgi:hypothetical protein